MIPAILAMALLLPWRAQSAAPAIAPLLGPDWSSVALPDMPLGLAEHGGTLWVCGSNEMIAESSDGGRHWTVEHERGGGQMLFQFAFYDSEMSVFGSGGVNYTSQDHGAHWRRWLASPPFAITKVQQVNRKDFYATFPQGIGSSHNGGRNWKLEALRHPSGQDSDRFDIGAVDGKYAIALLNGQTVFATSDGGSHWKVFQMPAKLELDALRPSMGTYWAAGEVSGTSAVLRSADGTTWTAVRESPVSLAQCTAEGCLVGGGWVDLTGAAPQYHAEPTDSGGEVWEQWAAAGGAVCHVSEQLRCRLDSPAQSSWPPLPADKGPGRALKLDCQHCPTPDYPASALANREQGTVVIDGAIDAKGRIEQAIVVAATWADMAKVALRAVRAWRWDAVAGLPGPVSTTITVNFAIRH
ncbi:MAG: TonB family protein [Terriglobales bacterium]